MELTIAAIPTRVETAGANIFEQMERNESGKRGGKSEDPAPSDCRSRMERTMRQQAQELTQLHRTVEHLTNLLEAQAARQEAQWLGMTMGMQEREHKWDARHEDDKLWGAGITNKNRKSHEWSSTRPVSQREGKRKDCKDGGWGARGLTIHRYDARRGTRAVATAAAATEAQTAAQTAAYTATRVRPQVVLAMGPGLDSKNGSVRFQNRPKTRPSDSWRAKRRPVPVNPLVSPGLARPVGSNLRFCVSGFTFMVAFRYGTGNRKILTTVCHGSFSTY